MDKVLKPQIVTYVEKGVKEDRKISDRLKNHAIRRHFYSLARDLRELAQVVVECQLFFDHKGEQMYTNLNREFLVRDLLALSIICEQCVEENLKKEKEIFWLLTRKCGQKKASGEV